MKKKIFQNTLILSLVLAMQAAPLSYAAEPEPVGQSEEVSADQPAEGDAEEASGLGEVPGNESAPDGTVQSSEKNETENDEKTEGSEEQEEDIETAEPEIPTASGETGIPGWLQSGSDWYYYDANGAKAYGWRYIGGIWYYFDRDADKAGIMLASVKRNIGGAVYFFDAGGAMRTGWIKETEGWYYAGGSGAMLTGWQWINGAWYYLDGTNAEYPGLMLEDCKRVIGNATYFFSGSGAMRTGWIQQNEGWYYSDTSSSLGWKYINGAWYYLDGTNAEYPGLMLQDESKSIGGLTYCFSGSGAMRTGWIQETEGWYYTNGSGAMLTGWQWINGVWYYLDGTNAEYPGLMLEDCKRVIGNATYFFSGSGAMRTGWIQQNEGWYYSDTSSSLGWKYINGVWYYLDGANAEYPGLMAADCKMNIGGATYFFQPSGAMITGWAHRPEGWYYAGSSGAMVTGWLQIGSKWYYLDPANAENQGLMAEDCEMTIGGLNYGFMADGSMRAGWSKDENGDWYYYDTYTGQIKSGWQYIGGAWYYLDPDNGSRMLTEGWHTINGGRYYMYGSGAMATNWLLLGSDWYYLGTDGAMKTGWHLVNGRWYYMYRANDPNGGPEGVMAKNTTIDGYELSGSGAMYTAADIAARNVLNSIGWDLRAAFNWSAGLTYYRMTSDPSPGSEWFANYGFQNGRGNCYVMAATFCYMARMLGYDAHQMAGMCPTISGGMTPHSWCEVVIGGTTYVFDPNFTNETGRNGYQITYGTSGTWRYTSYYRMN